MKKFMLAFFTTGLFLHSFEANGATPRISRQRQAFILKTYSCESDEMQLSATQNNQPGPVALLIATQEQQPLVIPLVENILAPQTQIETVQVDVNLVMKNPEPIPAGIKKEIPPHQEQKDISQEDVSLLMQKMKKGTFTLKDLERFTEDDKPLLHKIIEEKISNEEELTNMVNAAKILLTKKLVSLDAIDTEGNTALHVACAEEKTRFITLLLDHKAPTNKVNNSLTSPYEIFSVKEFRFSQKKPLKKIESKLHEFHLSLEELAAIKSRPGVDKGVFEFKYGERIKRVEQKSKLMEHANAPIGDKQRGKTHQKTCVSSITPSQAAASNFVSDDDGNENDQDEIIKALRSRNAETHKQTIITPVLTENELGDEWGTVGPNGKCIPSREDLCLKENLKKLQAQLAAEKSDQRKLEQEEFLSNLHNTNHLAPQIQHGAESIEALKNKISVLTKQLAQEKAQKTDARATTAEGSTQQEARAIKSLEQVTVGEKNVLSALEIFNRNVQTLASLETDLAIEKAISHCFDQAIGILKMDIQKVKKSSADSIIDGANMITELTKGKLHEVRLFRNASSHQGIRTHNHEQADKFSHLQWKDFSVETLTTLYKQLTPKK